MLIYKDIISGDELLSDSFGLKEVDGVVYEADCAMITIKDGDVDVGANPSAEGGDEDLDENSQVVNNVVHSFRLQPTSFDKKTYLTFLKSYMKNVKSRLQEKNAEPETITAFEKGAQEFLKSKVLKNFKDYEFYTGESMDAEGMIVLLNYREDGVTPYVTIWKHGVEEMKV